MALTTRELAREEWPGYFDDFSRNLDTLVATVEVAGREIGDQIEADRLMLTGISYDRKDDIVVIGLDAQGGVSEELEHIVYKPQKIYIATGDGEPTVFDIADAEGQQTLVRLEPSS
jgi:Family of unknown function (DUF5335)